MATATANSSTTNSAAKPATNEEIQALEMKLYEMTLELNELRKEVTCVEIPNYEFATQTGATSLLDLFADHEKLLLIHNMGQSCRYCTLWADGFNGLVDHLESAMSVVLVSKDSPELQRQFANSRGWRFQLASHGGGSYITEQSAQEGSSNMPGAVVYERRGDKIFRRSSSLFGPGDLYSPMWNLLGLAGLTEAEWTPQFRYWRQPEALEDGGENVLS